MLQVVERDYFLDQRLNPEQSLLLTVESGAKSRASIQCISSMMVVYRKEDIVSKPNTRFLSCATTRSGASRTHPYCCTGTGKQKKATERMACLYAATLLPS